jgi:hypothetical protein
MQALSSARREDAGQGHGKHARMTNDQRLRVWHAAARIIRLLANDASTNAFGAPVRDGRDSCGWRGDSRDVAIVADYISGLGPEDIESRTKAALAWVTREIDARRAPTTIGVINHLKATFR